MQLSPGSPFEQQPMMIQRQRCAPSLTRTFAKQGNSARMPTSAFDAEASSTLLTPVQFPGPLSEVPPSFFELPVSIRSPVDFSLLSFLLASCPDRPMADYVLDGFSQGFRLGFVGSVTRGRKKPLRSSTDIGPQISTSILKELNRGHTAGPFLSPPFKVFHLSPLGGVPKKDGTTRIILDLSSPVGSSVNNGISREAFSVNYAKFDEAVDKVRGSTGSFMGKLDIRHAFRLCPVHPADWPLLVYWWDGRYYVDLVLPFGGRSSPFIFNTTADALQWIAQFWYEVEDVLHYLDDYFFASATENACRLAMDRLSRMCQDLGVPLATDKTEGPTTVIQFLGIEIDSVQQCWRLSEEKLYPPGLIARLGILHSLHQAGFAVSNRLAILCCKSGQAR